MVKNIYNLLQYLILFKYYELGRSCYNLLKILSRAFDEN